MRITLTFIFLLFAMVGLAQDVSFGIKTGFNFSDIVLNDVVNPDLEADYKTKVGYHAGAFAILQLDKTWGLAAELQYSLKGVNAAGTNINLHYACIPVLLKYSYSKKLRFEAGPEIGYLFLANSKYGNVSQVYNNNLDIGIDLGAEFMLSEKLFLGARFGAGFSSVIEQGGQTNPNVIKYQNRVLQLSIGYALGKISL